MVKEIRYVHDICLHDIYTRARRSEDTNHKVAERIIDARVITTLIGQVDICKIWVIMKEGRASVTVKPNRSFIKTWCEPFE